MLCYFLLYSKMTQLYIYIRIYMYLSCMNKNLKNAARAGNHECGVGECLERMIIFSGEREERFGTSLVAQ